ncbi:MAG: hypothetical protein ACM3S1_07525 [Hyphomicrobiales bacterium]
MRGTRLFRRWFGTPAREALGWSALGMAGMFLAAAGIVLLTSGGGNGVLRVNPSELPGAPEPSPSAAVAGAQDRPTPTPPGLPAPSAVPSRAASPSPTATPTTPGESAGGTSTVAAATATSPPAPETATPTPPPTEPPLAYCPPSGTSVPGTVFGILTIDGEPAPPGTVVSLLFDGVPGPSAATTAAGGYRVDWAIGEAGCANAPGAAISVVVAGESFPAGSVGEGFSPRVDIAVE